MNTKLKRIVLLTGMISLYNCAVACTFSISPAFGADWYHGFGWNAFLTDNPSNSLGIMDQQRYFERAFLTHGTSGPMVQPLREIISDQSFFYQAYVNPRFQVMITATQTHIAANAVGEAEGLIGLSSSAKNQLGFSCDYLFRNIQKKHWLMRWHLEAGGTTSFNAVNKFTTPIDWVKLYPNEISPRILAGSYNADVVLGIAQTAQRGNFGVQSSLSARIFVPNAAGFVYGNDINAALNINYRFFIPCLNVKVQPQIGLNAEYGSIDWQKSNSTKELTTLAQGEDVFFASGGQISFGNINLSGTYRRPLWQANFSQQQLYNKGQFTLMARYCF